MALKDSFINLNKALRTTLQNVPAVVDTLIKGFDEIGDAAEAEGTYSATAEQEVGTWIDGKKIYRRTVEFPSNVGIPANTWTEVEISTAGIDQIISVMAYTSKYCHGYVGASSAAEKIQLLQTRTVQISVSIVVLEYTKAGASRSPKNGTRNGGDDKPDVKTVEEPAEDLKK